MLRTLTICLAGQDGPGGQRTKLDKQRDARLEKLSNAYGKCNVVSFHSFVTAVYYYTQPTLHITQYLHSKYWTLPDDKEAGVARRALAVVFGC